MAGKSVSCILLLPTAAADAAMDAKRQTLTSPMRWGVGGWPRGRGGTCHSRFHLSSSTVCMHEWKAAACQILQLATAVQSRSLSKLSAGWWTSLCDGLAAVHSGEYSDEKKKRLWGLRCCFVVRIRLDADSWRKLSCSELSQQQAYSHSQYYFSTYLAADKCFLGFLFFFKICLYLS